MAEIKGLRASRNQELKSYINLAEVQKEKPAGNWLLIVPGIVLVVLLAVLFSKFAVVDRFSRLAAAQAEVAALKADYDAKDARLHGTGELTELYYHYTWSDLSRDEGYSLTRERVAGVLSFIMDQDITVQNASLAGRRLLLRVSGENLQQISDLSRALDALPEVESVSVTTAQGEVSESGTFGAEDDEEAVGVRVKSVGAQLQIYIRYYDDMRKAQEAE